MCGPGQLLREGLSLLLVLSSSLHLVSAIDKPPKKTFYRPGGPIEVSCLNRTVDTGEHVQDSHGVLQYIPFPTCNETSQPLTLSFLSESPPLTCTIPELSDEFYHLLEFYIHQDSPMTCRIPRRPPGSDLSLSTLSTEWIPLVISISGNMEQSHLHIANHINLLAHVITEGADGSGGPVIDSATAYSSSPLSKSHQQRVIVGSPLPLHFSVRWYNTRSLPRGTGGKGTSAYLLPDREKGEHVTIHTIMYCILSCIATTAVCAVYFRGWEFPKRLRRYDFDRRGGGGGFAGFGNSDLSGRGGSGFAGYAGFGGYGVGAGPAPYGKKD